MFNSLDFDKTNQHLSPYSIKNRIYIPLIGMACLFYLSSCNITHSLNYADLIIYASTDSKHNLEKIIFTDKSEYCVHLSNTSDIYYGDYEIFNTWIKKFNNESYIFEDSIVFKQILMISYDSIGLTYIIDSASSSTFVLHRIPISLTRTVYRNPHTNEIFQVIPQEILLRKGWKKSTNKSNKKRQYIYRKQIIKERRAELQHYRRNVAPFKTSKP